MSKPRFGIDLDGVLYHWDKTARFLLSHQFGIELAPESETWDHIENEITKDQWKWLWTKGVERGLFRHGNVYRGSIEALNSLSKFGDNVIITNRSHSANQDTMDWLSFHRIPTTEIHLLNGNEPKSIVQPQCDLYVDDNVDKIIDLYNNTDATNICMWKRKYNQYEEEQDRLYESINPAKGKYLHQIDNWTDVILLATTISGE